MKRVLLISYAFPPLSIAGTFRPLRFVKYLPDFGWLPTVITAGGRKDIDMDATLIDEVPDNIKIIKVRSLVRTIPDGYPKNISLTDKESRRAMTHMASAFVLKGMNCLINLTSVPDSLIYWVPPVILTVRKLLLHEKYQAVITTSPPHSSHLVGMSVSKKFKIPWIADFRDPWVDNVYFNQNKGILRRPVERLLEKTVVKKASAVIANTEANRLKLSLRYGLRNGGSRLVTITNGFDKRLFESIAPKIFDIFTIVHTGSFYSVSEPYFFFDAFAQWIDRHKAARKSGRFVQLLLIGSENKELDKIVNKLNLREFVNFIPRLSHRESLAFVKGAHLLLTSLGFKEIAKGWIPLKLYDYLASNRPILGIFPEGSDAAKLVQRTRTGYVLGKPEYKSAFNVLDEVYANFRLGQQDASLRPDRNVISQYDSKYLTKRLAGLLDEIASKK